MKKQLLTAVGALLCAPGGFAQTPQALPLYPDGAVESNGFSAADVRLTATNLDKCAEADYFVFPADPAQATGQAVVICPGGGYISLAYGHEGLDVAEWMNEHGITAVVLRYRMPNGHPEIPLKDAQTALKLVRQKAADWHVDPNRVGIMGFSAGGHLAATAATHFTGPEDRPDFSILIYPVISMDSITHQGSKDNLLGTNAPAELAERKTGYRPNAASIYRAQRRRQRRTARQQHRLLFRAQKAQRAGRTARLSERRTRMGLARFVRIPRRTARFARPLARRDPQIRIAESPLR